MVEVVVVGMTKEKEEEKTYLMSTMNTNTVGGDAAADDAKAAAGDHHPSVNVDGKKLKAWLIQINMWSSVYFLLYWIRMVMIRRDYYGVAIFLHGILPFSLLFFGTLVAGGIDTVNKINSLVLLVNNNIIPSPGTFKSSTTTIDEMKKEISGAFVTTAKADDDQHWYSQVMFAGCIFFVTLLHTLWYDHTISKELGLEDNFHMKKQASVTHTASINQPSHTRTIQLV